MRATNILLRALYVRETTPKIRVVFLYRKRPPKWSCGNKLLMYLVRRSFSGGLATLLFHRGRMSLVELIRLVKQLMETEDDLKGTQREYLVVELG